MISSKLSKSISKKGWTLVELISVLLLVTVLSTLMTRYVDFGMDSARGEATRAKMSAIFRAIIGTDLDNAWRERTEFGFVGDIGRLPTSLAELTTQGALPNYAFLQSSGFGVGWRGPYVSSPDSKAQPVSNDEWGRNFTYSIAANALTLTSLGSDGLVGGAGDKTDLALTLAATQWRGTVRGIVRDGTQVVSGATVELRSPSDGAIAVSTATTDVNGVFSFSNVPFGVRSFKLTSPVTLAPAVISIFEENTLLPERSLALLGTSEAVTYIAASSKLYDTNKTVAIRLKSTVSQDLQLDSVRFTWAGGGTFSRVILNERSETLAVPLSSGSTFSPSVTLTVSANSPDNDFQVFFSTAKSGVPITILLTWKNRTQPDTITVTP